MTLEAIAKADGTVDAATVKRNLDSVIANAKTEIPTKVTGKDGKTYPTKKPRKKKDSKPKTVFVPTEIAEKAENLPETFVDHAEEIWRLLENGNGKRKTQQEVADEMGWGLDKVKKYSALEKISPVVWGLIVPETMKFGTSNQNSDGTHKVPTGTITENLLRNILDLTECHQKQIVEGSV
jgi:hypothetical protein